MTPELAPRLFAYLGGIVAELGGSAVIINGTSDHVHMLLSLPPALALSDAMRVIKTNSSRWVHETTPARDSGWQTGFGAFSVSLSNAGDVTRYVANQQVHHRRVTFQEEYLAFLKKHGIALDGRSPWD